MGAGRSRCRAGRRGGLARGRRAGHGRAPVRGRAGAVEHLSAAGRAAPVGPGAAPPPRRRRPGGTGRLSANFPARVREIGAGLAPGTPVEVWFQDEMRVGQKGTLTRVWAETGSRPSAPRSDGYQSVYLFGAVCPSRGLGCALILPRRATAAGAPFLGGAGGPRVA